jgi:hypothetical protein
MAKVVKKKLRKTDLGEGNKDVFHIFQETLSMNGTMTSLKVTYPKFLSYAKQFSRYLTIFKTFSTHIMMIPFKRQLDDLVAYTNYIDTIIKQTFYFKSFDYPPTDENKINGDVINYALVTPDQIKEFTEFYTKLTDCELIKQIIITCNNLIQYKKHFQDIEHLNKKFLTNLSGLEFNPVEGLNLNFKELYINDAMSEEYQNIIMYILNRIYNVTYEIYTISTSPDIDVDEFVKIVKVSISQLKHEIPRCEIAFKKIEDSIDLLKNNFGSYYKDFRSTGNPAVIMENFVVDVTKTTNANTKLAMQFKKIIMHYRKLAAGRSNDPKLKVLFQQFDRNMEALDKATKEGADESSDDESDDDCPNLKDVVDAELSELLHKFNLGDLVKELQGLDDTSQPDGSVPSVDTSQPDGSVPGADTSQPDGSK